MSVKVTIKHNWPNITLSDIERGWLGVITDVDARSAILAPKLTLALVNSRRIEKTGDLEYTLSYGSERVPYARKRHFENKAHPDTIGYLSKAAESVAQGDIGKHFRGRI